MSCYEAASAIRTLWLIFLWHHPPLWSSASMAAKQLWPTQVPCLGLTSHLPLSATGSLLAPLGGQADQLHHRIFWLLLSLLNLDESQPQPDWHIAVWILASQRLRPQTPKGREIHSSKAMHCPLENKSYTRVRQIDSLTFLPPATTRGTFSSCSLSRESARVKQSYLLNNPLHTWELIMKG